MHTNFSNLGAQTRTRTRTRTTLIEHPLVCYCSLLFTASGSIKKTWVTRAKARQLESGGQVEAGGPGKLFLWQLHVHTCTGTCMLILD